MTVVTPNEEIELIAVSTKGPSRAMYRIWDEVWLVSPYPADRDTYNLPMGRRWECSYSNFLHYWNVIAVNFREPTQADPR